jgi:hydrogenase maturation protease
MSAPIRIFAWGNRGRRDDGVALALAEQLEIIYAGDSEVAIQQYHQLGPELVEDLGACRLAVFLDAHVGAHAGKVAVTRITPAESGDLASHHCSPDVLLAMCRSLRVTRPDAYLVAIPAEDTGYGDHLSATAARAVRQAEQAVRDLIESRRRRSPMVS